MSVEGSLDSFRLSDILQIVAHQHKTGILTVQGESDIVAISFLRGQVVAADALTRTVEDGLGDVLVRQGLLARDYFDAVATRNQAGAGRLIDLLVEGGRVGRPALLAALREQTQTVLLKLLDWQQGEFKFYSGDEVSFEDGFVPISIEELLLRHLEVLEGPAAAVPGDDAVHQRVEPPPREIRERLGEPRPGDEEQEDVLWLSPEEMQVWERVDGQATTAELVAATALNPHKVRLALHRLLKAGALALVGPPGAPDEEAAPAAPAAKEPPSRPSWPFAAIAPASPSSSLRPIAIGPAPVEPRRPRRGQPERWVAAGLGVALAISSGAALGRLPSTSSSPFPGRPPSDRPRSAPSSTPPTSRSTGRRRRSSCSPAVSRTGSSAWPISGSSASATSPVRTAGGWPTRSAKRATPWRRPPGARRPPMPPTWSARPSPAISCSILSCSPPPCRPPSHRWCSWTDGWRRE